MVRGVPCRVKNRDYYIFFRLGGKYSGCYAVVQADNKNNATLRAWEVYGFPNVGCVENNETVATAKILAYNFKPLAVV